MQEKNVVLVFYATTFLHPGSGSTTGTVDLPVQREVHTDFPYAAGSGLKGSLREKAERNGENGEKDPRVVIVFGPETGGAEESAYAGCLSVGDARLLAMPVRSVTNTFMWTTCPLVLQRLARDAEIAGIELNLVAPRPIENSQAFVPAGAGLPDILVLEDVDFRVSESNEASAIAQEIAQKLLPGSIGPHYFEKFKRDFVILSDNRFSYFARYGTQVSARIALNERKTTTGDGGNLWYEETIPPETVFYSILMARKPRSPQAASDIKDARDVMDYLSGTVLSDGFLRIGGNETVGQGWCLVRAVS
ncbi:MAG: type III-B CRISPR module RAMP protein Cmr4 [Firmicutes bacterium]|nr:type III-B CRISPR module RAMP protein Cmr4 [Bacillota bacterium]